MSKGKKSCVPNQSLVFSSDSTFLTPSIGGKRELTKAHIDPSKFLSYEALYIDEAWLCLISEIKSRNLYPHIP